MTWPIFSFVNECHFPHVSGTHPAIKWSPAKADCLARLLISLFFMGFPVKRLYDKSSAFKTDRPQQRRQKHTYTSLLKSHLNWRGKRSWNPNTCLRPLITLTWFFLQSSKAQLDAFTILEKVLRMFIFLISENSDQAKTKPGSLIFQVTMWCVFPCTAKNTLWIN